MRKLLGLVGLGAALTYFFDPQQGRGRRAQARDRIAAFFRSRARQGERIGRAASAQAEGRPEGEAPPGGAEAAARRRHPHPEGRDGDLP